MTTSIQDLLAFKTRGQRFVMLTCYDYPTAQLLDELDIPVLLVGDSLAQVVLGYPSTLPVTMDEMLHHCRAVTRAATRAMVVADMPFMSYQASIEDGLRNAGRFLKEGGAHGVKVEGPVFELTQALTSSGIPVMAHLGLTPQSVHTLGGYRVQGRGVEDAQRLVEHAMTIQKAGASSLVLECVPSHLAAQITEALSIPTIGIGAGPHCDGQVLVINDLLGMTQERPAKFVKRYSDLHAVISQAVRAFVDEVSRGEFPAAEHSYD